MRSYIEINNLKLTKNIGFVICSKGIELDTGYLISEIVEELKPDANIAVLSGPSFAKPVAEGLPTAVTIASKSNSFINEIINIIGSKNFRPYISNDTIGVQINSALKNIIAIAAGVTDGLGLGENARASIITRGIREISILSMAMGGSRETILSLSGIGDIILTCTSISSRNYSLGKYIGEGKSLELLVKSKVEVTEGIDTVKSVFLLGEKFNLDLPIIRAVKSILAKEIEIKEVMNELLERSFKIEGN